MAKKETPKASQEYLEDRHVKSNARAANVFVSGGMVAAQKAWREYHKRMVRLDSDSYSTANVQDAVATGLQIYFNGLATAATRAVAELNRDVTPPPKK